VLVLVSRLRLGVLTCAPSLDVLICMPLRCIIAEAFCAVCAATMINPDAKIAIVVTIMIMVNFLDIDLNV
jgi:hypothetical protein